MARSNKEKQKGNDCKRVEQRDGKKYTTIKYRDGSGFLLVSKRTRVDCGKVDFSNSREATSRELDGFTDWQPSE